MVCIGKFFWAVILSLTIHEESMDIGALPWWLLEVLSVLLCYIHSQSHLVQGPLILAGNALKYSWKEKYKQNKNTQSQHIRVDIIETPCRVGVETVASPVRKDCGLKKPGSQTTEGRSKSAVHPSNSRQLAIRSPNL